MAGFTSTLAIDAKVEKHIELSYSLSGYRKSHLTTIKAVNLHLWLDLHFALALDANEIQVEKHIELCCSLSRTRKSHLTTIKIIHVAGLTSALN